MLKTCFRLRSFIFRIFPDSASRHCRAELEPKSSFSYTNNQINTSYLHRQLKLHVRNWSCICWATATPGGKEVCGGSPSCIYLIVIWVWDLCFYCPQIAPCSSCLSTLPNQHTRRSKYWTFRSFLKELAAPQHLWIVHVFRMMVTPWHGEQGRLQCLNWGACQAWGSSPPESLQPWVGPLPILVQSKHRHPRRRLLGNHENACLVRGKPKREWDTKTRQLAKLHPSKDLQRQPRITWEHSVLC